MAAKDYELAVSQNGKVWIAEIDLEEPNKITTNRKEVAFNEFVSAIVYWSLSSLDENNSVTIDYDGKPVLDIKVHRENLPKQ
jgi:hypothetical protein